MGLPPTEERVRQFLDDESEQSFDRVVDEVLDSWHYGERWARHWLDVVRFGESTGYEVNRDRENAYHYRDYVIESLNADKSYRDFVIEQLAGDSYGDERGTGFLVGGPFDLVKSPDVTLTQMQRQDELADYVNTTGTAFLGMTIGCARCHNHKFDPILQKDFYSMQAVFAGVVHGDRELRSAVSSKTRNDIDSTQKVLQGAEAEFAKLRAAAAPARYETEDLLPPVNYEANTERFDPIDARFVRFTIRDTTSGEPCIDELRVFASASDENVALAETGAKPSASGTLPGYEIHKLEHINDGKFGNNRSWISNTAGGGWVQIEFAEPVEVDRIEWGRDRLKQFKDRLATNYVIEVAREPGIWKEVASSARRQPLDSTNLSEDAFVARLPAPQAETAKKLYAEITQLRADLENLRKEIPKAYLGTFNPSPERIYRLYRGEPSMPREEVVPDALSVVGTLALSNDTPESKRRIALAHWIASPHNPLTARVIVNRVWHYHFGIGLVSTPSDFGKNGTRPTHPELLDWLATRFMENNWSLKWLHREIVSSHAYQQSSAPRADAMAIDADSRLLWRFPPRRLEAEAIRDCVLHVSGALNLQVGGPGFLLFNIDHENVHHYFPKEEFGPEEFRRMIYMTKIRQEQDGVFGVFDCPDGAQVVPDRSQSTTPLQALNLMNSRFMLQQAAIFAARIRANDGDNVNGQVVEAFKIAFSREPNQNELQTAAELAKSHGLESLCRALFNANEFLYIE